MLSFDRSSPVRDYWLAHCEGFRLVTPDGRRGVVEGIGFESADRPEVLAVRFSRFRKRRLIAADAVEEVIPAERLLVIPEAPPPPRAAAAPASPSRSRIAAGRLRATAARATVAVGGILAAALHRLLLLLSALARSAARAARRAGAAGSAARARWAPVVRREALLAARGLRSSAESGAATIRRGAAAAAIRLREAERRGRAGATRLRLEAPPRLHAAASRAVRAAQDVNGRLEGPLLRLHRRFATSDDRLAGAGGPGPLLPRSFRPPARSGRRPDSPTPSTTRRSS